MTFDIFLHCSILFRVIHGCCFAAAQLSLNFRGSYPAVPSRYSFDLRSLVSQLFRRNPRERPSINSILRLPFLANLTGQFLSPEQHEEEFSHTVLHKGRPPRPSSAKPSGARYQPAAGWLLT